MKQLLLFVNAAIRPADTERWVGVIENERQKAINVLYGVSYQPLGIMLANSLPFTSRQYNAGEATDVICRIIERSRPDIVEFQGVPDDAIHDVMSYSLHALSSVEGVISIMIDPLYRNCDARDYFRGYQLHWWNGTEIVIATL